MPVFQFQQSRMDGIFSKNPENLPQYLWNWPARYWLRSISAPGWNRTNGVYREGARFTVWCHRQLDIPTHMKSQLLLAPFQATSSHVYIGETVIQLTRKLLDIGWD